jgi:hypothetical protein
MFKTKNVKIALYTAAVLIVSGGLLYPQLINASRVPGDQKADINQSNNVKSDPSSALIFKANSNADKLKFKFSNKEQAIKETGLMKDDGKVLSAELVTFDHYSRDVLDKPNLGTMIENDRMVWVVTIEYPTGIKTKGGNFSKAVQISAYDAETGRFLGVTSKGEEAK